MTDPFFSIGKKKVAGGAPAIIVAEVAQAHDGSLLIFEKGKSDIISN